MGPLVIFKCPSLHWVLPIVLKSAFSEIYMATPTVLWAVFVWYMDCLELKAKRHGDHRPLGGSSQLRGEGCASKCVASSPRTLLEVQIFRPQPSLWISSLGCKELSLQVNWMVGLVSGRGVPSTPTCNEWGSAEWRAQPWPWHSRHTDILCGTCLRGSKTDDIPASH